ncbi:hypothetical protein ONZ51_g1568 [Trametes cubensis]|uniref:Secreted protein n=1 Tax=Trametes cubensis TaxID=1111947 RepID=A0AAD7XHI2_9APHY|nr:hypothetical protein ONZ51_g1568 [Trametes cubensis]
MQKKQAFSPIWASTLAAIFLRTVLVRDGSPTADAVASKERANARAVIMPRLAQPLRTAERCPNVGLETRSLASVPRGAAHRWNATGYRLPLEARAAGPDLPDTHYTHFHLKRDGRSGHFGRTPSPLRSVMAVRRYGRKRRPNRFVACITHAVSQALCAVLRIVTQIACGPVSACPQLRVHAPRPINVRAH